MARNFPDWIQAYVETLTPKGEAPARFHLWTAVSTIGACLRRRVYIDMGTYKYIPNFYIILVAPPGVVKKSTSIGIGASMLHEIPGVYVGADVNTWQSFVEEVGKAEDMFAEGDPALGADALLEQKHTVTCAVSLCISEFGTFFDPEDAQMVNVLTELYDGKSDVPFRKRTKTQGSDIIINPFINIIAGTTPQWMRDNFRGRFGGWGLSSRCIFLYCDKPYQFVPYPDELWGAELKTWRAPFVEDLREIASLQATMLIHPEARELWRKWYPLHGARCQALSHNPHHDPWLAYYLARKPDHINKLALVLAVSRNKLRIGRRELEDAIQHCDEIEEELSNVFRTDAQATRIGRLNQDVWDGLKNGMKLNGGVLHEAQVYGFAFQYLSKGDTEALIKHVIAAGYMKPEQINNRMYYRLVEPTTQEHGNA